MSGKDTADVLNRPNGRKKMTQCGIQTREREIGGEWERGRKDEKPMCVCVSLCIRANICDE